MSSRTIPALLALGGVVLAVVLFVLLKDDDSENETTTTPASPPAQQAGGAKDEQGGSKEPEEPEIPLIEIKDGQPVGGVQELEVEKGGTIHFVVASDVDEEVHLHGYDVAKEVAAGGEVEFAVPATIDGIFEAELENSAVPIAEITVAP